MNEKVRGLEPGTRCRFSASKDANGDSTESLEEKSETSRGVCGGGKLNPPGKEEGGGTEEFPETWRTVTVKVDMVRHLEGGTIDIAVHSRRNVLRLTVECV